MLEGPPLIGGRESILSFGRGSAMRGRLAGKFGIVGDGQGIRFEGVVHRQGKGMVVFLVIGDESLTGGCPLCA